MKTTQDNSDKILRDKINSIDSLPENYTPSLNSKWELLMAGMQQPAEAKIVAAKEEKERKRYFFYYAAAACFLCVFTFGWLFLRNDKLAGNHVAVVTDKPVETSALMPEKTTVAAQSNATESVAFETEIAKETTTPAVAKKPPVTSQIKQVAIAATRLKTVQETMQTKPEPAPEKTTQTEQLTSAEPEQLLANATPAKSAKTKTATRKKAKSVELDFEPENMITPSQHNTQVAQQNLKFKFFPITEGGNTAQHESPLKFTHTF